MQSIRHLALAALLCFAIPLLAPTAQPPGEPPVLARVTLASEAEVDRFVRLGLDLLETREGDDLFALTTRGEVERLRAAGWRIRVEAGGPAPHRAETFQEGYRTVTEIEAQLQSAVARHPQLAELTVIGESWERRSSQGQRGHNLFALTLTNRAIAGPKPTFFLLAAIHARELATAELAMRFVDHLLNGYGADGDATMLLDETRIVVVPLGNPDGRRIAEQGYQQRKNTNPTNGSGCAAPPTLGNQFGVDLNRNYAFQWGAINPPTEPPCGATYPGPVAASEPETEAVQSLVRALFPDQRGPGDADAAPRTATGMLLTLHSYGNLVLWPWGATRTPAPNAADLELIGRKFAFYNGYTAYQSIRLYPTSGTTDDWSYGELGVASFTFEIGPNSGPCAGFFAPYRCLSDEFWPRNLPALLYAARIAAAPYALAHGPTPEEVAALPTADGRVEIRARFDETANGGQPIASAELFLDAPPARGGSSLAMNPADGRFDSPIETATLLVPLSSLRTRYLVRARDAAGNDGPLRAAFLSRSALEGRGRMRR